MATTTASGPLAAKERPPAAVASEPAEGGASTAPRVNVANRRKPEFKLGGDGNEKRRKMGLRDFMRFPSKLREHVTTEDLRQALKKQVEYYFADITLGTDTLFHGQIQTQRKKAGRYV